MRDAICVSRRAAAGDDEGRSGLTPAVRCRTGSGHLRTLAHAFARTFERRLRPDAVEKVATRCCHPAGGKIDPSDRPTRRSEASGKGKTTLENFANSSTPTFSTTSLIGSKLRARASVTLAGIELMHCIRKGQFDLAGLHFKESTAPEVWMRSCQFNKASYQNQLPRSFPLFAPSEPCKGRCDGCALMTAPLSDRPLPI